jgi:hypothetical protein
MLKYPSKISALAQMQSKSRIQTNLIGKPARYRTPKNMMKRLFEQMGTMLNLLTTVLTKFE